MWKRSWLGVLALLSACSSGSGAERTETAETAETSSTAGSERRAEHPIRTTTPVPVPQPAIARGSLSARAQRVWELVEVAVALRPPEPPAGNTAAEIRTWSEGPFLEWLARRAVATAEASTALEELAEAPAHERGLAAALMGYLRETTCADVRGAPVPEAIAADRELLEIYDHAMFDQLLPVARLSVQAYTFCVGAFDESPSAEWSEWASYCRDRGDEVSSVFGTNEPR